MSNKNNNDFDFSSPKALVRIAAIGFVAGIIMSACEPEETEDTDTQPNAIVETLPQDAPIGPRLP